jgi:hypothetical protein
MFIAALFTITMLWKQPRCPTTDDWIKKMCCLHTMEFYSTTKENEIFSFTGKWIEMENSIFFLRFFFNILFIIYLFIFNFYFIHMCIQCLGHFSLLTPAPSLIPLPPPSPPQPLATRQKLFYPYL